MMIADFFSLSFLSLTLFAPIQFGHVFDSMFIFIKLLVVKPCIATGRFDCVHTLVLKQGFN